MIGGLENKVEGLENRLNGLGKVDSIEHRVTSNQIDITDIKEALERMEELQTKKVENILHEVVENLNKKNSREFNTIHKRLDSHLLKLGKVEEDILMIKED
ncbi:hypothetical protein GNT69_17670 [Bacillus sp. B15-48]|nr:hypothetical protein [Bacillus sp. B15-48]